MYEYAGTAACAKCHAGIVARAGASSMARTLMHTATADVLHQHTDMEFQSGALHFSMHTHPDAGVWKSSYAVSDGQSSSDALLLWIFGTARVGQSYLYSKPNGRYYEARVTFFQSLKNIGFTPARELSASQQVSLNTEQAMGREVQTPELIRCFSCHATAVNLAGSFNAQELIPGVTCEACHGPGARHVSRMAAPAGSAAASTDDVYDPSHLSPTESIEFCGACHGSWWDVKLAHVTGPSTVRSAPYRLATSKCWGKEGDPRLICTACHDPHRELVTDISSYDAACLRCHASSGGNLTATATGKGSGAQLPAHAPACPVAKTKCASCHMPEVYVPEMKNTFTDHRIRIVKQGETFQD